MRAIMLGIAYFAAVFAIGFVLGTVRVLWLIPAIGVRYAELAEIPLMIAASWVVARSLLSHFGSTLSRAGALTMGIVALVFLLAAEFTVVLELRGLSLTEYLAGRDPISAAAYYLSLVAFALMPWLITAMVSRWDHARR